MALTDAPTVVELCAGTRVLSRALVARGWDAFTVDVDPRHAVDLVADVSSLDPSALPSRFRRPTLVWSAPPCVEFSRTLLPWVVDAPSPSLDLVRACVRVTHTLSPRWWAIENVRGAIRWFRSELGAPLWHCGSSWYLWGDLPPLPPPLPRRTYKANRSSSARVARASYPVAMVDALADALSRAVWPRQPALPFRGAR